MYNINGQDDLEQLDLVIAPVGQNATFSNEMQN